MAPSGSDTVSVVERTRPIAIGTGIVGAHFLGRTAAFVLGEEAIVLAPPDGEPRRVGAHGGAILRPAGGPSPRIPPRRDRCIGGPCPPTASAVFSSCPPNPCRSPRPPPPA